MHVKVSYIIRIDISDILFLPIVSFSNIKPTSMVHLMYRKIHFTASQWPLQGSCIYLLAMEITCDKSDLIHNTAYIKLLTALTQGKWDIYSCFSTALRDIVVFNLKWGANGILINFVSPLMLNFWIIFFKYPFCINQALPFFGLS